MKGLRINMVMLVGILLLLAQLVPAQVLSSCDKWASYNDGNYVVYNNLWGENVGTQCITATSTTKWTVKSNQTGSGVKTYPNSSREPIGVSIGSLTSMSSSMNVTVPSSGDFNASWDIWAPTEVMIWIYKSGSVSPWGSFVETATIGGQQWDVYKNGYPGFLTKSNVTSLTVNVKAILDYCVSKGWLQNSGIIEKVQGGFEITATSGEMSFTMNSYSVSFSSTEPTAKPIVTAPPSETIQTNVWYKVLNGKSSKCMQVENGSTSSGAAAVIWDYDGNNNQQWMIQDAGASGAGYYKIINRNSNLCLQIGDWSTADGGMINVGTFADYQNNQQWTLTKEGNYYQIINRNSSKLADVVAAGTNNGTKLHQWTYYATDALSQRWSFISTGATVPPTPTPTRTPTPTPTRTSTPTPTPTKLGDANGDGSITIVDALLVAQYSANMNPAGIILANCDVTRDGAVNITDAMRIAQYAAGIITSF